VGVVVVVGIAAVVVRVVLAVVTRTAVGRRALCIFRVVRLIE
jgi:hypothetical protein